MSSSPIVRGRGRGKRGSRGRGASSTSRSGSSVGRGRGRGRGAEIHQGETGESVLEKRQNEMKVISIFNAIFKVAD